MEEWKEYKARDFCSGVTDGTHDSPKPTNEGYYLITSKHLKDNLIDFSSANRISGEDYRKVITRSAVEQYDIIARSKSFIMIIMTSGFILPFEVANMEGGSPDSLMSVLTRACPRLAGGPRSTGAGIFIACAVLTAIDLFAWIGLIALCILHQ